MKVCSICREELPLEDFALCARNKDGHRSECKSCQKDAGISRTEEKSQTYAQRILTILSEHGKPMSIHELRACFAKSATVQSGVSSALVNMRDRGQLRITGGGHNNSVKTIEIIPAFAVPKGRIIRLTDTKHWVEPPIRSGGVAIQSGMNSVFAF